jgi:hypothetical protein
MRVPLAMSMVTGLLMAMGPPGQTQHAQAQQAQQAQQAPAAPTAAQPSQQLLKAEELDALLAPVALYPDALLASVMMASTYPLEVVQADRWAQANKNLKSDALAQAAQAQGWDNSVVSLVSTPSVLTMMSTKLDWTQKLGDAVLAQQPDVMDAVQRLRAKAQANNKLTTTKEQKVTTSTQGSRQVIAIEPAQPSTVYVPYYDPAVVYGGWPYPSYPPYAFPYAGWVPGAAIATGLAFGAGIAMGAWAWNNWGGGMNWGNNNINVNRNTNINSGNNNWSHNVDHRHGVRYNNSNVQQKFGGNAANRGQVQNRMDFRGRDGKPAIDPGNRGDRAGDRDRGGARDRAGNRAGDRGGGRGAGDRGGAGQRGGGDRAAARGGGGRDSAFSGAGGSGRNARAQADRGRASMGGGGGGGGRMAGGGGGGGPRAGGGGGGGMRGGGGGGGGRGGGGGGGRRSDIRLKHDVVLLGHLQNGLGFYRFVYDGGTRPYVGVIAQEVQTVRPDAVVPGQDGYLRVRYGKLGVNFESYQHWLAAGGRIPSVAAGGDK